MLATYGGNLVIFYPIFTPWVLFFN